MHVPFVDLSVSTTGIKQKYLQEIGRFLDEGKYILGPDGEVFEREWAAYVGSPYCVGVSSGADALYLALLTAGVHSGDEVITQANAYNASVTAIIRVGAKPRFADIEPDFLTIDTKKIEALITPKTKAILVVHLYGQMNNMREVEEIARKHKLKIIEDCAQAHGATFFGKAAGTWGDANAFSFYPTKNLGAFGDAGAVVTHEFSIYQELLARRNLGQVTKNDHRYFGTTMRLDTLQAIALHLKLPFLGQETVQRQKAAARYTALLESAGLIQVCVRVHPEATHVYHLYVIVLPEGIGRQRVQEHLLKKGIDTAVHYPLPVYRQPFFTGEMPVCPVADATADRLLSLPLFPHITAPQQEYVIASLREII